jgi:non-specific serine/threonine protein kinase
VRETISEVISPLREFLYSKRLLLVLDNFEQITEAAPLITDLLTNAPHLKAIVTSRAVLHVYGEHEYPVPPLALPDVQRLPKAQALSFYTRFASVQLFKDRARAVKPDFQLTTENAADVARICAWLDGLPLAIEMAAAQVKWLPLTKLLAQLSDRLATLTGGPLDLSPRQQSLTGAIDWSYHLLDPIEQRLFEVLGVFSGCDEEAILDLPQLDERTSIHSLKSTILNLVEKSLVRYELVSDGTPRYTLYEMIGDYARDKLREHDQLKRARQIHAEHYYRIAQTARPHVTQGSEQVKWLNRLEVEHNNLRAALAWSLESADRAEFAYRLAEALHDFWQIRGHLSEGRRWQEQVLALAAVPAVVRAQLLSNVGQIARMQGDYAPAQAALEQASAIQQQANDAAGQCRTLEQLAILAGSQGDYARARDLLEETLEKRQSLGDDYAIVITMNNLAIATRRLKDFVRAGQLYAECAALSRTRNDQRSLARALYGLGEVRMELDDYAEGLRYFRESLKIRQRLGSRPEIIIALGGTGMAYFWLGDAVTAATIIAASEKHRQDLGMVIAQVNRPEIEESIAQVREKAGAAFEAAWVKGRALSLDEAVELAVK